MLRIQFLHPKSTILGRLIPTKYLVDWSVFKSFNGYVISRKEIEHVCYSLQEYVSLDEGLRKCVMKYCASRSDTWEGIRWRIEGYFDKLTGEKTRYKDIPTWKNKIKYFCGYCLRL